MKYDVRMGYLKDLPIVASLLSDFLKIEIDIIINFLLNNKIAVVVATVTRHKKEYVIGVSTFNIKKEINGDDAIVGNYAYIDPNYRRKGLLIRMLKFIEAFASANNIKKIYAGSNIPEPFYKMGYKKVHEILMKEVLNYAIDPSIHHGAN